MFDRLEKLVTKGLESPDAIARVVDGVKVVADAVREVAFQRTAQEQIRSDAAVEIARIHAVRDVMLDYLDRSFDERRKNFDMLFAQLDRAVASESLESVARTLDAIVALSKTSPFKDLADAAKAKDVLKDKSKEWDL